MNEIIRNLTIQNFQNFKNSFEETKNIFWDDKAKKLRHSGEFGQYREELVKKWIRVVVPEMFGISSGFLVNPQGDISTQCDIIIYDRTRTPKIENIDNQKFFPIETVSCIGEVKSDINSMSELNSHLIKLAQIKKMRDSMIGKSPYYRHSSDAPFSPTLNPFDNIFSFLICRSLNFKFDISKLDYGIVEQRFKHNIILSLKDGMLNYKTKNNTKNLIMPFMGQEDHIDHFHPTDNAELPSHILNFLHHIAQALDMTTLLAIEIAEYPGGEMMTEIK